MNLTHNSSDELDGRRGRETCNLIQTLDLRRESILTASSSTLRMVRIPGSICDIWTHPFHRLYGKDISRVR